MSDFVGVKDKTTGHEFSVRHPNLAKVTVIDERAVDVNGRPLPATPKAPVPEPVAAKKKTTHDDGEPVTTPKEGSE